MTDKKTPVDDQTNPPKRIVVSSRPSAKKDPIRPEHHEVVSSPVEASTSFSLGGEIPEPSLAQKLEVPQTPKENFQPKTPSKPKEPPQQELEITQKEVSSMKAEKNHDDNPPSHPPKKGSSFSMILSLIALMGLAGMGYWVYQGKRDNLGLASKLESNYAEIQTLKSQLHSSSKETLSQDQVLLSDINQLSEQVKSQGERIGQMGGHENWKVQEARYLTVLAMERLTAFQDIQTASQLLKDADDRLKDLADPRAMSIRQAMAEDRQTLSEAKQMDQAGLWVQLNVLSQLFDKLDFYNLEDPTKRPADTTQAKTQDEKPSMLKGWREALNKSWQEIKGLVRVRDFKQENLSLALTNHEQEQLKRTLNLLVEEAKWGVLNKNETVYKGSLESIEKWLNQYFVKNELLSQTLSKIGELKDQSVESQGVQISRTLPAIEAYLSGVNIGPTRSAPPPAAPSAPPQVQAPAAVPEAPAVTPEAPAVVETPQTPETSQPAPNEPSSEEGL